MRLDAYLHFNGNCAEAFHFYQEQLGGTDLLMMTWGDSPAATQMPAEAHNTIMHAHITIGASHLMGSDANNMYHKPQGFRVSLDSESIEEDERLFAVLSEGGTVEMPIAEPFWAIRFGMLTDRFGIPWMINHSKPMPA